MVEIVIMYKRFQYLPKRFARENGLINKKCDLVIRDERQRSWNLKLNTYNHGVYTGEGWHEVCVDNDLKEGDCIKFEVVTNKEKPIWKFHEGKLPADEPPILPPLPLVLKNEKRKAPYVTPQSKKFEYRDWDCDRECDRDYDLMHPLGSHKKDFASPVDVEQPIDSNEPTYCVCNQVDIRVASGTLVTKVAVICLSLYIFQKLWVSKVYLPMKNVLEARIGINYPAILLRIYTYICGNLCIIVLEKRPSQNVVIYVSSTYK
ncbi:hypothetical protein P3S67_025203 [Capsicum chacoense]